MKKLILVIYFLSISTLVSTQSYFSSTLTIDQKIFTGRIVQFNNQTLIVSHEFCEILTGYPCVYIRGVNDDKTFSKLYEIFQLKMLNKSAISNSERLTIIGLGERDSLRILQFNQEIELINEKSYPLGQYFAISNIIEFADHFIIAGFAAKNDIPKLLWFDAESLNFEGSYSEDEEQDSFGKLINHNNNLYAFHNKSGIKKILIFDEFMNVVSEWEPASELGINYFNFEITKNTDFILHANSTIYNYSLFGELNWKVNIGAEFEDQGSFIFQELKETTNGDILIYGKLDEDIKHFGLILLESDGTVKWKRLYKAQDGSFSNNLKEFVERDNSEFTFYATYSTTPYSMGQTLPDSHWILRTDNEGCIDSGCGEVLTSTIKIDSNHIFSSPNPSTSKIKLNGLEPSKVLEFSLKSLDGRLISNGQLDDSTINIEYIDSGVYLLQIFENAKLIFTEKIVKI